MDATLPLELHIDLARGGRWTSLAAGGREWLWHNPDAATQAARSDVLVGQPFVDAGGGEECFPCIRAPFDHGLVWSRPWAAHGRGEAVHALGYTLERTRAATGDGGLALTYTARATTPRDALHATHLLLDLSADAELHPGAHGPLVFWDPRPDAEIDALGGEEAFVRALGRGERGAVCYALPDCHEVTVRDGADALHLSLASPDDLPLGFVIWRNLGGWPADAPYRSIGVEPAVGRDVSLPTSVPGGAVTIGPGRDLTWTLTVRATRRADSLVGADEQP